MYTTTVITDTLANIQQWHQRARPNPDSKAFNVQLGCHFEEIVELLAEIESPNPDSSLLIDVAYKAIQAVSVALKKGTMTVSVLNQEALLDSIADQIVTGVGVAHCLGMDSVEATKRVDRSNWSKFVDGFPVFDANGKIAKPDTYQKPDLTGCY